MPFINTKTNIVLCLSQKTKIKDQFGAMIGILPGKSEQWLMVGFDDKPHSLFFGGSEDPAAIVEVKVYGTIPNDRYDELTQKITNIISTNTGIGADRIYVKYSEVEHWGWSGSNF